ncbi:MAG: CHAD domain-containing protein [Pseudomonadota bacterium]
MTGSLSRTQLRVLDSIDGRLLSTGHVLFWQPTSGRAGHLSVRSKDTGERLVLLPLRTQPASIADLPAGLLGGALHRALNGRALVDLVSLRVDAKSADVSVKDQTIADVTAQQFVDDTCCLWIDTRRGFEKEAKNALGGSGTRDSNLETFHRLTKDAEKAAQLNNKGFPALKPAQPASEAVAILHKTLLAQMMSQVDGTCRDVDIEFLHDLRVASRRARSLLQTVKSVFAEDVQTSAIEGYRWIGQQTTDLRDLDVYLDDFPALEAALSPEMRSALQPFRKLLTQDRSRALRKVRTTLTGKRFGGFTKDWDAKLAAAESFTGADANKPIFDIAGEAIWKRYRRICKDGAAINDESPAEALHDLRKQGKKLRYLLEFFASLYPEKIVKPRITALKKLQDLLGGYQDCAVQAEFLENKAARLRKDVSVPADTLMAMGALADQRLQDEKRLRQDFQSFFKPFASDAERAGYRDMTKSAKTSKK